MVKWTSQNKEGLRKLLSQISTRRDKQGIQNDSQGLRVLHVKDSIPWRRVDLSATLNPLR